MARKSQLYLYTHLRDKFINDLIQIKELFFERIEPIFSNAEKEADDYQNKVWNDIMNKPCYGEDDYFDPGDYVDTVQQAGFDKFEILSLMQYRNIGMWISCMCQVWEQQLFSFVINEAVHEGIKYEDKDLIKGFIFSKEVFAWHNVIFEKLNCWSKIKELRLLVNVLKHSEGESEKKLRVLRPDYFIQKTSSGDYDLLSLYHSTLLEATLQISNEDFIEYFKALETFWRELPERMFTAECI